MLDWEALPAHLQTRFPIRPLVVLIVAFGCYDLAYLIAYAAHHAAEGSGPPFGDFFAFWSFAKFSHERAVGTIYDAVSLQQFQQSLSPEFHGFYPFPYPPIFLLFLWPLGFLGYPLACAAWIGATFALYVLAIRRSSWRSPGLWLGLTAPATLLALISGQNGFLTAAILIGGLRLLGARPLLGGLILGCLSFKPQLVILIPVVLLAGSQWRALLGMTLSVFGLAGASILLFGLAIWMDWLKAIPDLWQLFEANRVKLSPLMPTVTISALLAGLSPAMAKTLQVLVSSATVLCLAMVFRGSVRHQGRPCDLDIAALIVGVFLVTPYAFIYDMPAVTPAVAALIEACRRANRTWKPGELLAILAALLLPLIMSSGLATGWPLGPITLILLFGTILRVRSHLGPEQGFAPLPLATPRPA